MKNLGFPNFFVSAKNWYLLLALSPLACGGAQTPPAVLACGAENRPQLNCESEFKYDARKIEGGFSAAGLGGAHAKTEDTALRQIDTETERFVAQSRRLCEEYNKCVIDRDVYATRSENLRRRMARVPELYDALRGAPNDNARRNALAAAYEALVPEESRTDLSVEFAMLATRPQESDAKTVSPGTRLPTNTRVSFLVRPSRTAHVYLVQKGAGGKLAVLFPDPRITVTNPIAAGSSLRIPQGGASFRLNEKDIGTERVYIVASLEPLGTLDSALDGVRAGHAAAGPLGALTAMDVPSAGAGCTRGFDLEVAPQGGCVRSRGFDLVPENSASAGVSLRAKSEAADSVIAQVFSFEHVQN